MSVPLDEDHWPMEIPDGCVENARVEVVQYIRPDATVGTCVHYSGDVPLSQTIGLLAQAGIDLYLRCEHPELSDEP